MATYLVLYKLTEKGIDKIKDSPSRIEDVREIVREMGGEVKTFCLLMGRYDTMMLIDLPDDATAAKAMLSVASKGYVRTETLRAFTEAEYRGIIDGVR